jgi:tetratricopeptide (TPR) repeat protein
MARMKIGDKGSALADLTKAINLNNKAGKKDSFSYCTRALVNSTLGNFNSAIIDATEAIKIKPKYPEAFHFRGLAKMSLALKQLSLQTMDSSIQDLNYAKEQCLQAGNMELYYQVLESYKRALTSKQVIEREIELRKQ